MRGTLDFDDMHARTVPLVTALVAASLFAFAPAASASTIYPPSGSCTTAPTATTAGGTVQFACQAGTFAPAEDITITVTGENGAASTIGMVRTAITTASGMARSDADGALPGIALTLPSDATGTYNVAALSASSAGGTAAVTIRAADGSLSATGVDGGALAALLIGGGGLVALGAVIAIVAAVRRRRAD